MHFPPYSITIACFCVQGDAKAEQMHVTYFCRMDRPSFSLEISPSMTLRSIARLFVSEGIVPGDVKCAILCAGTRMPPGVPIGEWYPHWFDDDALRVVCLSSSAYPGYQCHHCCEWLFDSSSMCKVDGMEELSADGRRELLQRQRERLDSDIYQNLPAPVRSAGRLLDASACSELIAKVETTWATWPEPVTELSPYIDQPLHGRSVEAIALTNITEHNFRTLLTMRALRSIVGDRVYDQLTAMLRLPSDAPAASVMPDVIFIRRRRPSAGDGESDSPELTSMHKLMRHMLKLRVPLGAATPSLEPLRFMFVLPDGTMQWHTKDVGHGFVYDHSMVYIENGVTDAVYYDLLLWREVE